MKQPLRHDLAISLATFLSVVYIGHGALSLQYSQSLAKEAKYITPLVQERLSLQQRLEHNTYIPTDIPPLSNAIAEIPESPDYIRQAQLFRELKAESSTYLVEGIAKVCAGFLLAGAVVISERKRDD